MRNSLLFVYCIIAWNTNYSQEYHLQDSILYTQDKPLAIFHIHSDNSLPLYTIHVVSFKSDTILEAELIEFTAPVRELKSFYYYELRFPQSGDTVSLYQEGEAFSLTLTKIFEDYHLLKDNRIDTNAIQSFKNNFKPIYALQSKINEISDYLVVTRNFDEQVQRDRTKPVSIVNDRVIMQDGVKIGIIGTFENVTSTNRPIYAPSQKAAYGEAPKTTYYIADYIMKVSEETQYFMANGRRLDFSRLRNQYYSINKEDEIGYQLFQVSKKKKYKVGSGPESRLRFICYLIEDYYL